MPQGSPLGQITPYVNQYDAALLYPVERSLGRSKAGIDAPLPFIGVDLWTAYELSWLAPSGKPQVAMATFTFPCSSPCIVESKSFKLYLNSFTQTTFDSWQTVQDTIQRDLSLVTQSPMLVELLPLSAVRHTPLAGFEGVDLDSLDISTSAYEVNPAFLKADGAYVEETLCSDLLKSNCLATGQPDWGSLLVRYAGPRIDHAGLLRYIISYRNHSGFAEHCVEQIFNDLWQRCRPERLTVYCRYTRRGGLDINPFRSTCEKAPRNAQHARQ